MGKGNGVAPMLPRPGAGGYGESHLDGSFHQISQARPRNGPQGLARRSRAGAGAPGLGKWAPSLCARDALSRRVAEEPPDPARAGRLLRSPDDAPPSPVEHRDGALTLSEAREKARDWLSIIKRGTDPKIAEDRRRAEAQRAQANTFAYVAEEFLTRHAAQLAHAKKARSIIEAEFVGPWGARPVTDILPEEAAAAIRAVVKRGSPYQAHSAYEWLRRLYNWAIGTSEFGIMTSPVAALRPSDLIGKKSSRDRTLTDDGSAQSGGRRGAPSAPGLSRKRGGGTGRPIPTCR